MGRVADYRKAVTEAHKVPIALKPERRRLLMSQSGTPLRKSALDSAWQRMMHTAIKDG